MFTLPTVSHTAAATQNTSLCIKLQQDLLR